MRWQSGRRSAGDHASRAVVAIVVEGRRRALFGTHVRVQRGTDSIAGRRAAAVTGNALLKSRHGLDRRLVALRVGSNRHIVGRRGRQRARVGNSGVNEAATSPIGALAVHPEDTADFRLVFGVPINDSKLLATMCYANKLAIV